MNALFLCILQGVESWLLYGPAQGMFGSLGKEEGSLLSKIHLFFDVHHRHDALTKIEL